MESTKNMRRYFQTRPNLNLRNVWH